jgi:aminobenzoyl-glutamate utilization protein B
VTKNVVGIPTAVMGEAGQDGPVIAILGEYDALPGLSQEAGVAEPMPLAGDGYGHGCGHNLLGSASMLAATAVKDYLAAQGIKGRVRYHGCPAEEGGAAKGFMARAGAFSDVDMAISWHPAAFSGVNEAISLANTRIDFTFHGRASHAAAARRRTASGSDRLPRRRRVVVELGPDDCAWSQPAHRAAGARFACSSKQGAVVRSRAGASLDDPAGDSVPDNPVASWSTAE